jgi:hypothetical protein
MNILLLRKIITNLRDKPYTLYIIRVNTFKINN